MEALIAEAAARGETDMGLVSVDSATSRAHHIDQVVSVTTAQISDVQAGQKVDDTPLTA